MAILITGGTGFIGSHTVVELLNDGRDVVILDNLSNSKECVIDRIETITGKRPKFYNADLLDYEAVDRVFNGNDIVSPKACRSVRIFRFPLQIPTEKRSWLLSAFSQISAFPIRSGAYPYCVISILSVRMRAV